MLINQTYFIGDLFVPNTGANTSAVVSGNKDFDYYIDQYEPEILIRGLGIQLYKELLSNVDTDPESPTYGDLLPGADQKWSNLLEGTDYGDKTWRGLRFEAGTKKMSLMAYYVYYKYWEKRYYQRSTLGVIQADMENGDNIGPSFTMEDAWRTMHEWYGTGSKCSCAPWDFQYIRRIPGYFSKSREYKATYVDMFTFLHDNSADYANWRFTHLENKNRFGL